MKSVVKLGKKQKNKKRKNPNKHPRSSIASLQRKLVSQPQEEVEDT